MQRRLELDRELRDLNVTPKVKFANSGKKMIIEFNFNSKPVPPNDPEDPEKDTHRDIKEINNNAYSSSLSVYLTEKGRYTSKLDVSLVLNSKIPGTGSLKKSSNKK